MKFIINNDNDSIEINTLEELKAFAIGSGGIIVINFLDFDYDSYPVIEALNVITQSE